MTSKVETYYNISEKQECLARIYDIAKDRAVFIVPSGLDKEPMLQLISGYGSFFGKRPAIWTWGEFYREISLLDNKKSRRVIDPPDHNLIIRYILNNYLKECGTNGVKLPDGVKHAGFASILGDNIKDLLAEEISPEHLRSAVVVDNGDYETAEPEAILCRLYSDYIEYLKANSIADNAQIPTLISELLAVDTISKYAEEHTFIHVGFLSFTGGQLKLIDKLKKITNCVFVLPETGIDSFHDAIRQVGSDYTDRPSWSTNIIELEASNSHLEYDALARELALWVHGKSDFTKLGDLENYGNIGIQVPEDHLRVLENSLSRYKIPFNTQVRGSVAETLLGELPKLIWDAYFSGWDTKATAFLLSDPLLGAADFDASECMAQFPEGVHEWEKLLNGRVLDIFKRVNILCRELSTGGAPVNILKLWRNFLSELDIAASTACLIDGDMTLDDVIKDLSSSLGELDKKIEILEDINKDLGKAAKIEMKGSESVSYILDWSRTATLPIQLPQSRSVTIYAGMPPVLTTHRYWIMTDIDYNTWPGKLSESPLLCNESKKRLNGSQEEGERSPHIPDIHEEREQKEALFRRLVATGKKGVIIARALTDSNGRPVGASQFMEPLFESEDKKRRSQLIGKIEYPLSRSLPEGDEIWFPDAEINNSIDKADRGRMPRFGQLLPDKDKKTVINLSEMDNWLICPYLYWCKSKLKLDRGKKELFDTRLAGIFLHELWENCWYEHLETNRNFYPLFLANWEKFRDKNYLQLHSDQRLSRHEKRLRKQAMDMAGLQDAIEERIINRKDVQLEYTLDEYEIDGVIFRGRCDRIDFYDDGAVILDYKLNKANSHKDELQLAAYAAILKKTKGIDPLGYGWFGHADNKVYGFFEEKYGEIYVNRKTKQEKTLCELIDTAEQKMADMADAVKKGIFPANYQARYGSGSRCSICDYYGLCRKREAPYYDIEEDGNGTAMMEGDGNV